MDVSEIERIMVRTPKEVVDVLRLLAKQHDRSLNGECLQAFRAYIDLNTPAPKTRRVRKEKE
jgi:hypothetical protein